MTFLLQFLLFTWVVVFILTLAGFYLFNFLIVIIFLYRELYALQRDQNAGMPLWVALKSEFRKIPKSNCFCCQLQKKLRSILYH